uniref:Cytochrome c biogenesis protein Ccs1 n=1 Tax=Boldia erythrosiphon TaxID=74908 RepID=A0A1Y9TLY7_9RHOD|nr:cytochrome c biogenesis protein ccs1 [Boldia erythrosiphon]ARO90662.1 cytochrome c biogenesis protein ccs1 [Boldia erythrosiphon]
MKKKITWLLFKLLTNLKTAIVLLLLIASFSIVGTIIEQDKSLEFYQFHYSSVSPLFGIALWQFIKLFGIDHIYTSLWFLVLLLLFSLSLASCTFSIQFPLLKISKQWYFYKYQYQFNRLNLTRTLRKIPISICISNLNKINYSVFQQKKKLYGYKGLLGRLSPIIVHLSIILILSGTIISIFTSFVCQQIVPRGEVFHLQNLTVSKYFSFIPQNTIGKVHNFWIDYNTDGSISQFFSDIELQNSNGELLQRKTISVNTPLIYKNLSIYQTDWNIVSVQLKLGNNILQLPCNFVQSDNSSRLWTVYLPITSSLDRGYIFIISGAHKILFAYNLKGELLFSILLNQLFYLHNVPIIFLDIFTSTGLQIKSDFGIPVIYFGFLLLIISIIFSYINYCQLWFSLTPLFLLVGGNTNRSFLNFEEDLWFIENSVNKYL